MGRSAISRAAQAKRSIGLKLAMIARHMRTSFDQRVEKTGITGAQWRVIVVVSRHPGATQRTIADALELTEVTAGRLVDRLCEGGYLERRVHPEDRRAYRIYLTKSAHPLLKQLKQMGDASESQAFAGLNEDELCRLDASLEKIARNMSKARNGRTSN